VHLAKLVWMMVDRGIGIGGNVGSSIVNTGDHGKFFQIFFVDKDPEQRELILQKLRLGEIHAAEIEGAVPLPALTLGVTSDAEEQWRIVTRHPEAEDAARTVPAPWSDTRFVAALEDFQALSRRALEKPEDAERLDRQAEMLGEALAAG
jgi:hypothetical protein